ncbi:MAG: antitoxin VbhA family protein [Planctomycetota bacterium]|jgi:putative transcriptional regulator|nr:antitoxin VbhA family protein [Planctomycetota bacterium]
MPYTPIVINRKKLTILDVQFPNMDALESIAEAIGSNMFEGFQPTRKGVEIIRDYCLGKLTFAELAAIAREKSYAE